MLLLSTGLTCLAFATAYRHTEGWVNDHATWNVSLAYTHLDQTGRQP